MNKSIIIHNDNVPKNLLQLFSKDNIIKFEYSKNGYKTLDEYISKEIITKIKDKQIDIIYIKDNLSANYLELYGFIVAYHVRLSQELNKRRFIPIVLLSDIDSYLLNMANPICRILFTQNIFLAPNRAEIINKYNQKTLKPLTQKEYKKNFLNKITITPPENSTNHSIANEWAIFRCGEFLSLKSDALEKNKERISSMLYFKYLITKNPIQRDSGLKIIPKPPKVEGKIVYIDDEYKKGWSDILKIYFEKSKNIDFKSFEYEYKDKRDDDIVKSSVKFIKDEKPDIVLLDLRLSQSDHDKLENFTGIQILQQIHKINAGIQVIMLTATSKSTILEKLYKEKILGYIKKEHPEDKNINTKDNFKKFKELIESGFKKAYLKEIWDIQQDILKLDLFKEDKYNEIKVEIAQVFDILDSNMENNLPFAMLTICKVLEIVTRLYIVEKKENNIRFAYWIDKNEKINIVGKDEYFSKILQQNDKNDSMINKLRIILYEKLILKDKNLHDEIIDLVKIRNEYIHKKSINIEENKVIKWFKLLKKILEKIN